MIERSKGPELSLSNFWTITGDELVKRWGVNASIIKRLIFDDFLPVCDSKSMEIFDFPDETPAAHRYFLKKYITEGPFTRFQFRPSDIESFEAQNGKFLEELKNKRIAKKEQEQGEEIVNERPGETKPQLLDVDAYINKRRGEGACDEIIAVELNDEKGEYRLSYVKLAQALTREKGINISNGGWKMRGFRLCKDGKAMMGNS